MKWKKAKLAYLWSLIAFLFINNYINWFKNSFQLKLCLIQYTSFIWTALQWCLVCTQFDKQLCRYTLFQSALVSVGYIALISVGYMALVSVGYMALVSVGYMVV